MKDFYDLFTHELKDMYSAETQLERLLPEFARSASTPKLKEAFSYYHKEIGQQIARLEEVAQDLNIDLKGHTCEAMKVFLNEALKIMRADYPAEVRDAALISSMQRIKHYQIALYGTLKAFARNLGFNEAEQLLNMSSHEEGDADKKLTEIAMGGVFTKGINAKALRKSA
jgi:ferritin-like metal-binding protein YciE